MNCNKKINALAAISLFAITCLTNPSAVRAQDAWGSAGAGASASRSDSAANGATAYGVAKSGGASSWTAGGDSFGSAGKAAWATATDRESSRSTSLTDWTAGKAGFGYALQPGGLWVANPISNTNPGAAAGTKRAAALAKGMLPSSLAPAPRPLNPASNMRRNGSGFGNVHLRHSIQGPHFGIGNGGSGRPSGLYGPRHIAVGARRRSGSLSRGIARGKSGTSSRKGSPAKQPALNWDLGTTPSFNDRLDTGLQQNSGSGLQ